jgi:TfoX/Sxy family transcriptional regulator of competence genes
MPFDPGLAQRIRHVLRDRQGITERRMFGGIAFLLHGHMFVGVSGSTLMARVGAERHRDALAQAHVRPMDFTGRPMKGYVFIDPLGTSDDSNLAAWVNWCAGYVSQLPPKPAKP